MEAESIDTTETYLKVLAWLHVNQKKLMIAGGVVAVIALIIGIMAWQKSAAETDADAQLMAVPLMSVRGNQIVPAQATPLLDLAQKYPDTSAGEDAELLGAGALFTEGKYPEAHEQFAQFVEKHPESSLISQAEVGLAACLEGEGKISEAVQKYQEILSSYSAEANIVTPVKLTLARLYEDQNKPDKALQLYVDLAHINNPYDPWAAEARERGELLISKHPELRKAHPTSSTTSPSPGLNLYQSAKTSNAPLPAP